jgi:hypothetical protein
MPIRAVSRASLLERTTTVTRFGKEFLAPSSLDFALRVRYTRLSTVGWRPSQERQRIFRNQPAWLPSK